MPNTNPLTHRSAWISLTATVAASGISSAVWSLGSGINWLKAVGNVGIFLLLALWLRRQGARRPRLTTIGPIFDKPAAPAKALIAMVSKGAGRETALKAAPHHRNTLRDLWLITTRSGQPDAEWVAQEASAQIPGLKVWPTAVIEDLHSIEEVRIQVDGLRRIAKKTRGFPEADLICDFTGLTKHASAGMVLACGARPARLQYVPPSSPAARDERFRGLAPGTPIEVNIAYEVVPEEEED